ncbi:prenyltransferase/squalene oxidase repeat-containing protein [Desulfobacter curvatus]|uniref:prenyltransferase/squalene oxidase repeat-containing protein n=1 Tax=Desulfobacter curvatus TaxID=2290 RepID=UPI00037040B3|nr:prenyltransferase/squalene oxidase repeat-containing protein [Desulfobacter curvatus]
MALRFRFIGRSSVSLLILLTIFFSPARSAQNILKPDHDTISLKHELTRTYQMAYAFLKKKQNPDGSWSNPEFPALTGLTVYALLTSPEYINADKKPDFIARALDYIISSAHENGAIYKEGVSNYSTSICVLALLATKDAIFHPYIIKARNYIATLQIDQGKKGVSDKSFDGGIGYGTKNHSDIFNTCIALEAIKSSQFLESNDRTSVYGGLKNLKKTTLNWEAALKFIERCQNLSGYNDQAWSSADEKNKGGFVTYPGFSKAGEDIFPSGTKALRSYGSMTYAGLLSFTFADLGKNDPRVQAAYEWLKKNYTLDENPGLGQQGLYYYYYTMAKALTLCGDDNFVLEDGQRINWRQEMVVKFINNQKADGSWINETARWWENDPVLVTSYVLISLNMITAFI